MKLLLDGNLDLSLVDRRTIMAKEKCLNCGRGIGDLETAYIWNERIVCRSCYVKLQPRSGVSKGLLLVLGTVVVAAIGGAAFWISGPTRPPAPAAVRAPTVASAAPEPTSNAELERLRAENARLVRQVAARPSAPAFTAPPAPKGVAVSGSAYVVRQGGQSDILRVCPIRSGLHRIPDENRVLSERHYR